MLTILFQNIIRSKQYYQPTWVMIIIVLSVMILGYLYSAFNSRMNTFIKAVFVSRFSAQASREERSLTHQVSLLLSLNFLLIASLFILQLIASGFVLHTDIDFSFKTFLKILAVLLLIYSVKILFLRIMGATLDKSEMISEYVFTIFLTTQFLGILLLPVVVFTAYGATGMHQGIILIGCGFSALAFITRIGKGITTVLMNQEATMFYIILYVCTFEILPLLIGIKLIEKLA